MEVTGAGKELRERVRSERNDVLSSELALLPPGDKRALLAALPALESLAERLLDRPALDASDRKSR